MNGGARPCTICMRDRHLHRIAAFVACTPEGFEWFECSECALANPGRAASLTRIEAWFEAHGLPVPGLHAWRVTLLDLLIGRELRIGSRRYFDAALMLVPLEWLGLPEIASAQDQLLDRASGVEWIAWKAEQGRIAWGNRRGRNGVWCDAECGALMVDEMEASVREPQPWSK